MFRTALAALLLAATPAAAAELTAAQKAEIEAAIEKGGPDTDAAMYARAHQAPLAEAIRRMEIQLRGSVGPREEPGPPPPPPPDSVARIHQLVSEKEAATFAGLWVQHEPTYGIAVAFTRDAAATLRKYTTDPLFIPVERPGPSWRELTDTQERMFAELQRYGARGMAGGSDIKTGRIQIEVYGGMDRIREAIARGALKIPPYVDLIEPPPVKFAPPAPPPPGFVNPVKAFPRFRHRGGGPEILILRTGRVILDGGCLRLEGERQSPVVVWPNEAALDLSDGTVRIFHRMTGQWIRPGETITLGGASSPLETDADVIDADPACPGPYVHLTGFSSYAPLEAQMHEREARELARAEKVSLEEARRRLTVQREREAKLRAFGERLMAEAPQTFAALTAWGGKATLKLAGDTPDIPADLKPFITIERAPRPLAELTAERTRLLDQLEAAGLEKTGANIDIEAGRLNIHTEEIEALSQAAQAGRVTLPASVQIVTNGSGPFGAYSEWNMEAAWRALEAAPDFAEIRALVEAEPLPFNGDAPVKASRASSLDIARYMVMLGFSAKDIRGLRARGVDPVLAWVQQNGFGTIENRAVLAEQVVVGEVTGVDTRATAPLDGYRTSVRFRVVEALKGDAEVGDEAVVRLVSGFDPDGKFHHDNTEPMVLPGLPGALKAGDRYLLFLSSGQYANQARHVGRKPANPDWYAARLMSRLDGEQPQTPYGEAALPPLPAIRAAVAPVQAKFEASGVH